MLTLKEFDRRTASPDATQPIVSVRKNGAFGVNKAAYESMGMPGSVKIIYATEERVVGLRPADAGCPKAYALRKIKPNSYEVAGAAFLRFYGIVHDRARSYAAEQQGTDLLIYLDRESSEPEDAGRCR